MSGEGRGDLLRGQRGTEGEAIEVLLLGTGTSIPHPRRGSPGLWIRIGEDRLLVDGGAGSLRCLAEAGESYLDLGYLLYSHFHIDHIGDLVPLLFAYRNPYRERKEPLRIVGPVGMQRLYDGLRAVHGEWVTAATYPLNWDEMADEDRRFGEWRLASRRVLHTGESVAFRFEAGGRTVAYSGDSDYCEGLVAAARGADLFICECSFPDAQRVPGHLTPRLAGRVAREAGVRTLVLTHFYPIMDEADVEGECREEFRGSIVLGTDLLRMRP